MLLDIVFFILLLKTVIAAKTYKCSTKKLIYQKFNELTFFETPNYPKLWTKIELQKCNITFVLSKLPTKETWFYSVYTEYTEEGIAANFPSYYTISQNTSFSIPHFSDQEFLYYNLFSIQGLIVFTDRIDNCPLQAICNPFSFLDETQILHIRSNYFKNRNRKVPCKWSFAALDGYGFKIVIQHFNSSKETKFRIENSTDIIANERSVKLNHPYYNNDNVIQIYLSTGDPTFIIDIEFQAYISIVKTAQKTVDGNCTVNTNDTTITWTNMDLTLQGYQNNIRCMYNLTIPPKKFVLVKSYFPIALTTEPYVDYLKYYDNGNGVTVLNGNNFVIKPSTNDVNKTVMWEFVPDGSVKGLGFKLSFFFIKCECGKKVVECDGKINYLMNLPYMDFRGYYCGHIECNITIKPCTTELTLLKITLLDYEKTQNIYKVISNEEVVADVNHYYENNKYYFSFLVNSRNKNIFQVISFPVLFYVFLSYTVNTFHTPTINNDITVFTNFTSQIVDINANSATPVEMSDHMQRNNSFIIYCFFPGRVTFYNNKSFTKVLKEIYCFPSSNEFRCHLNAQKFLFYTLTNDLTTCAFRLSKGSNGCVFKENIFYFSGDNSPITAIANEDAECLVILLLASDYEATNLWTTVKSQNIKVYVGSKAEKLYFEFNSKTTKSFKNSMFLSNVYSILIPKKTTFFMMLKWPAFYEHNYVFGGTSPTQAIAATPDFNLIKDDEFYFQSHYNESIRINITGDMVIFNQNVGFHYKIHPSKIMGGVLLHIKLFNSTSL